MYSQQAANKAAMNIFFSLSTNNFFEKSLSSGKFKNTKCLFLSLIMKMEVGLSGGVFFQHFVLNNLLINWTKVVNAEHLDRYA